MTDYSLEVEQIPEFHNPDPVKQRQPGSQGAFFIPHEAQPAPGFEVPGNPQRRSGLPAPPGLGFDIPVFRCYP